MDKQLLKALKRNDLDAVKDLAKKEDFDMALILSAAVGHLGIVEFLVESGADIHKDNDEALQWAAENGHIKVVKFLTKSGANIHSRNNYSLQWAADAGHLDVVEFLIESGADVRAEKDNALQLAISNGHKKTAKILIKAGCDPANAQIENREDLLKEIINEIIDEEKTGRIDDALNKKREDHSNKAIPNKTKELLAFVKESISLGLKNKAIASMTGLPKENIMDLAKDSNCSGFIVNNWKEISNNLKKKETTKGKNL